ncbi:MAG: hypothetical protein GY715_08510 [Planctomycetes bacterium]|nr:hypothetical protein [Planctomycetota bacterium]
MTPQPEPLLARHDGADLYSAPAAFLKGLLESELVVSTVAGPRFEPFAGIFRLAQDEVVAELLRHHELRVTATPSADRAATLARFAARSGRVAVGLVPAGELGRSERVVAAAAAERLPPGGALCLFFEDRSEEGRGPRQLLRQLDLPTLEPESIGAMRDAMDSALRVSRAAHRCVALVVHATLLRGAETIETRPNRVIESVDAMLARRRGRRRPRLAGTQDVLRMFRRLEVNRVDSMPSPGERLPVGFVTIGPAVAALRHLTHTLRLAGRVPLVQLGAIHPVDDVVVSRLLTRCEQVIVLEPRPGVVEESVREVAEGVRRRGERPATVWGRDLPPADDGTPESLGVGQALHPSLLARRIVHLLHMLRPSGRVASQLVPTPPALDIELPPRSSNVGAAAAVTVVRRLLVDLDQWLREQRAEGAETPVDDTALAIDGVEPHPAPERIVMTETWEPVRFVREGIAALRQAARDPRPWIFLICDVGSEDGQDVERLVRGVIPAERADRVDVQRANLAETGQLEEMLRTAVVQDRLTVVIVADGPPARYDVAAMERGLAEIDRLGFEPRERLARPADRAGAVRPAREIEPSESPGERETLPMRSSLRVSRLPRRGRTGARLRVNVRPLLEEVEVRRTRPPVRRWRRDATSRLPLPEILHGQASQWRLHVAGLAGEPPGLVTRVLHDAGRAMGYAVSSQYDATPIGAGRRAWAQVLFTNPRVDESEARVTTRLPFGEADLLLGIDPAETLRAIAADPALVAAHADRTCAVVNIGRFRDERDGEQARAIREELVTALRTATRGTSRVIEDFAGACRVWFHTDRVVGLALLGAAYQSGLVPVTVDAIERAVSAAEGAGHGRASEAFRFGRHLALEPRLFSRPREGRDESVLRLAHRMVRQLARRRWGGVWAERFRLALEESLAAMPGLTETDQGRQARRDFVVALYRCLHWGGPQWAERYARLVTGLYQVDRGEAGRALTRHVVLPLAEAMLIKDPIYLAAMAASGEQRQRTRQLLNVKRGREDEIQRRFLTRFEIVAGAFRIRADVRTSDWAARVVASLRPLVPGKWRGTRRRREVRRYVMDLVERATGSTPEEYEHYQVALTRLHEHAVDEELGDMAMAEVRMLAEPDGILGTPAG